MDKKQLIKEVNKELRSKLGYDPYFTKNDKIYCSACHSPVKETKSELLKTKEVLNSDGDKKEVHKCPSCKYVQGINIHLKRRISELRKQLSLHEFNDKFRNKYFTPQDRYRFIHSPTGTVVEVSEKQLHDGLQELKEGKVSDTIVNEIKDDQGKAREFPIETKEEKVVEEETEKEEEKPEEDSSTEEIDGGSSEINTSKDDSSENNISETSEEEKPEEEKEVSDTEEISQEGEILKEEHPEEKEEIKDEESSFFDNQDDLSDLFGSEDEKVEMNESESNGDEEVKSESSEENEKPEQEESVDEKDDIDEFFKDTTPEKVENATSDKGTHYRPHGTADVKREKDPQIEAMLKANREYEEEDVFRTDDREEHVFDVIRNSRITDLKENYNDSNARKVVDRILSVFQVRGKKVVKHKVFLNDITHECPVVDFEGNIRLIFVDLDVPGGQYHIKNEINTKLRPTFQKTSEFELMTFVIYSDMIETNKQVNRVVAAVSKHIAFNLKIKGIFNPISVIEDSDRYFYTTSEFDKSTIDRFSLENCAGNVDKPYNGEVAIVSHWNNPHTDDTWKYRKEIQNRSILARGGEIDYDDLSMFMTCVLKYIMLPQKPDGTINVTIVDYIESLNLFIRDGFGALVGILVHNIKTQYPNSNVHIYYEMDTSMIPSPTIYRYVKNGSVTPITVDPNVVQMNNIINSVAKQNNAQPNKLYVEGEPFDSPEYNSNFWRSYILGPEYRRNALDSKRVDWRRFGRKTFAQTLGERFKDYLNNVNVKDRKARQAVLERIGYYTVVQPQVIKTKVSNDFGRRAFSVVCNTCSGMFSISQYVKSNRSTVVDDNYMNTAYQQAPTYNTMGGGYMTPEQQQAAYQQMMMSQMMGQGGFGGFQNMNMR